LYLIRENSSDSAELIEAFGKDFPTHVKAVNIETIGLSPVELSIYDLYYAKANAGELNDVTAANALMIQFAGDVVVSNDDGDGYKFCDKDVLWKPCTRAVLARYIPDVLSDVMRKVMATLKTNVEMAKEAGKDADVLTCLKIISGSAKIHLNYLGSATGMRNIWSVVKPRLLDLDFIKKLNVNHDMFPTMDGETVDLRTGIGRVRTREDMFSAACPVKYIRNPDLTNVMRFVNSIFCDDKELIDYMRARMGMFMTGRNVREFDIWYGEGCNGKSALSRMLGAILKSGTFYNSLANGIFVSNPKLNQSQKSGHTSHLVPLIGVRLGICQEIESGSVLNGSLIKSVSAGDPFKCRGAYEKLETEHIPVCKLLLCCNPRPAFDASDTAIVDRAFYCLFKARFVVRNPDPDNPNEKLADKVFAEETMPSQKERNNFFSWLVGGAMKFYANNMKLDPPQSIIDAKNQSLSENDIVSEYLSERCNKINKLNFQELDKSDKKKWSVTREEIITDFNKWMDDNGEAQPKRGFLVKRLEGLGYKTRKSHGSVIFDRIQIIYEDPNAGSDSD
jgi:phage/plasmid-associated DNA primase